MQAPENTSPVVGVVYNTSMSRPDAALALCALYGLEGRQEAHLESVCVSGSGLGSAIFCDMVARMYLIGPARNSNSVLPVGLSASDPLPPDAAMLRSALERKNEEGELRYHRSIRRISDTAMAEAALRNAVTFNAESVVILSAPATTLARALDLPGAREVYQARVKRLIMVDSDAGRQDADALHQILTQWPTPIFVCGKELGEAFAFPGSVIEAGFGWTPAHPAVDAYRAYRPMPYDAPAWDVAAVYFAIHPDSDFFQVSAQGNVTKVMPNLVKKAEAIQTFVDLVSAKPVPPPVKTRQPAKKP